MADVLRHQPHHFFHVMSVIPALSLLQLFSSVLNGMSDRGAFSFWERCFVRHVLLMFQYIRTPFSAQPLTT
jgi:hypothetical protein